MVFSKATFASVFVSLLACASAAEVPKTDYDVIVVGGGPAGLSALSGVSRVRRTALLLDSQEYRNAPTREMHDVIGNDGTPPAAFRTLAREQISKYPTAHFKNETVESIVPLGEGDFSAFTVTDSQGETYTARKIVLGTGVRDVLPATPGLQEGWGKGIFWCPWCDGYEHRDQPFGMIGDITDMLGNVLETHTLYDDVIAFVNGSQTADGEARATAKVADWKEQLAAWNTTIDNRTITSIERLRDGGKNRDESAHAKFDKFRLHFTTGRPVDRNALMVNFPTVQTSSLPAEMNLEIVNNKINVTSAMRASEPGVFAVGDANSDGSTNVPHAMFSGKKAAVYLHVELSREESKALVSKRAELSHRELEEEAMTSIGDNLDREWKRALGQQ
ncbi:FAD-dependent pyridine nucleotide-disulfide oxidoreductase [Penicillium bovifimosum]|uniref:FAD-dependent pyridine nucleotide-disulfide oxidoreductase n=1 Tax=Penicillium bovifimosum TaxID=126998 RepID=A0A9W9HAY1_9EURO|nr:FAD-dependent pyridine nucleotide-disulfide oxidoreductase [Penicillium bovifimosum]KAJ5143321.1 FAD-dependent pyridine nucleotide-disulfide oxidoreductase [Penicillium bovifimosum]